MVYSSVKLKRNVSWGWVLLPFDGLMTILAGLASFYMLFDGESLSNSYIAGLTVTAFVVVLWHSTLGLYRFSNFYPALKKLDTLGLAWFMILSTLALLAVMTKSNYAFSRVWLFQTALITFVASVAWRIIVAKRITHYLQEESNKLNIIVVSGTNYVMSELQQLPKHFNVVKVWIFSEAAELTELAQLAESLDAHQIWIIDQGDAQKNLQVGQLVSRLNSKLVEILYFPDFSFLPLASPNINYLEGMPVIQLSAQPLGLADRWLKTIFDYVLASIILILISPLLAIIAIGVKLSSKGPVFFKQERVTYNGIVFPMYKFRSMPVDVEAESGPVWAKSGEQRATAFGSFLRKTSLDELPQFINVLRGEMSIVGPRPERPHFVDQFKHDIPDYMQKHFVKAGITGWAQVSGYRGDTDLHKRVEHDLFYIENWNIWFDIRIILLTFTKGFLAKTAY